MTTTEPTNAFEKFRDEWTATVFRHPALTDGEKLALLRLMTYCNRKTRKAWPSAGTIAEDCALGLRLVKRALSKGTEAGLIVTVENRRGDDGKNLPTVRRFVIPEGGMVNERAPGKGGDGERACTGMVNERAPHGERACTQTPEGTPENEPLNSTSPNGRGSQFPTGEIEHPAPVGWDQGRADILSIEKRCRAYMEKITGTPPTDEEFADMLTEAEEWLGYGERSNWPAAFRGFVRDWSQTHGQSSPSRPSQGFEEFLAGDGPADTAPVRNLTPVSGDTPAPVIDAEIVDDHTEEETTMTPLRFSALFTTDPRPGTARCLSALSKLQKAGITDEEIHRAHEAGRMGQHPNPDDCAERIITDRETLTADCPF